MLKTRRVWFFALTLALLSAPCRGQVSSSTQQFARVYRAAQIEMDWLHCKSIACADLRTKILSLGPQFESGRNVGPLYADLVAELKTLNSTVLRNDYGDTDYSYAGAIAREGSAQATLRGLLPQDSYAQEQCKQGCDRGFAINALICAVLPPPLDALCAGAAITFYLQCLSNCDQQGGDVAITIPEVQQSAPLPSVDGLAAAIPRLALHLNSSELQTAVTAARSILTGGRQ